ncbi:tRNA lysidine(34) synthetase TilS [Halonatronum saccharophilum]|uniref:tRNA lysidine(34) synthetase TilS n=1 Tax=Halonatronum saccharophilum TaxID=150060 RepID=UPI0004883B68|nr:tRNA lysidine(34) synthetase TilS [Halonatronum saccharophilum]
MELIDKVEETINKYELFNYGDRVLVGVSGGPDSLALLHILDSLKDKYGLYLHIAHLDHRIRGVDSQEDAQFVRSFGEQLDISVSIKEYDVKNYSQKEGLSLEDAARRIRYEFFYDLSKKLEIDKIALGHHLKDQAETVLMKFIRGAGLKGLGGIRPKIKNIVRPLLEVEREEIEKYCQVNLLNPRIDQSNFDKSYFRNKVRLELIPFLIEGYNSNLIPTLDRTANLLREEEDFLQSYVKEKLDKIVLSKENKVIALDVNRLSQEHIAIKRRMVREVLKILKGDCKDFYYKHIEDVLGFLVRGETGASIDLPREVKVSLNYGQIIFSLGRLGKEVDDFSYKLDVQEGKLAEIDKFGLKVRFEIVEAKSYPWRERLGDSSVGLFDYNNIGEKIIIRGRQDGDRFYPLGMKGSKKVKDFLIDQKVPLFKRDNIPIFTNQKGDIFWVGGFRIDNRFKIKDETDKILIIEII